MRHLLLILAGVVCLCGIALAERPLEWGLRSQNPTFTPITPEQDALQPGANVVPSQYIPITRTRIAAPGEFPGVYVLDNGDKTVLLPPPRPRPYPVYIYRAVPIYIPEPSWFKAAAGFDYVFDGTYDRRHKSRYYQGYPQR